MFGRNYSVFLMFWEDQIVRVTNLGNFLSHIYLCRLLCCAVFYCMILLLGYFQWSVGQNKAWRAKPGYSNFQQFKTEKHSYFFL